MISRLPDDPRYWEALTDRLVRGTAGQLRAHRSILARVSIPLAIGAAAAAIAAVLRVSSLVREPMADRSAASVYGLVPADPLGASFMTSSAVPTMATLMATPTSERTQ